MAVTEHERRSFRLPRLSFSMTPENQLKIWRAVIVVAVLLLSVFMGRIAVGKTASILGIAALALIVTVVIMLLFSEHLDWGIVLLILTATYTPFSLPTGTNSRIVDSMVVAAIFFFLWILRMFIVDRRFHLASSPINAPLLAWMLVSVISLVWSMVFRDKQVIVWGTFLFVQLGMTALMVLLPAALLLVGNFGKRPIMLKIMTWMLVAAGPFGLVANFAGITLPVNVGGLFAMWVMALSLGMAFFQPKLGWFLRALLFAQVIGWVIWSFVLHISWLAGWLPGVLAVGILVLIRSRRLFMLCVLVVLLVFVIFNSYFIQRIAMERAESGDSRLAAWRVNWRVTGEHLLFGTGPGGYAAYYMYYFPNEAMATHSNYIDVLAQTGLVGFAIWLWFWGVTSWQGFRLMLRLRGRRDFYEALASAVFAGTIACVFIMMFGDWLLPFAYTQTIAGFDYAIYSWMFLGTIVAMNQILPVTPDVETA